MTNSEVIRKICKHAGINETEDQLFFDSFTKRLLLEFKPGDILKLGNIGFLHLKNIRSSESGVQLMGIVFSENVKASRGDNVFLISNDADVIHPIDFSFSPSFKKMEIPLSGEVDSSIFIPPSGNELLSFIDSKVENLFNKSEVIKNNPNDEVFIIPAEIPGMKVIENLEDISGFKSVLEEEDKKVDPSKFKKIDSITSGIKEDAKDKLLEKKFKSKPIIIVKEGKDDSKTADENGYDKVRYNRINSLTSSEKSQTEEDKKEEKIPKSEIPSVPGRIKQEMEKIESPFTDEIESEIEESDSEELVDKKELSDKKVSEKKSKVEERKKFFSQREVKSKLKAKFFIPLAVIVIIGFSIYFLHLYDFNSSGNNERIKLLPASKPVEIARGYDIPVDYPYQPNNQESLLFDGIDSSVYKGIKNNEVVAVVQKPIDENNIPTVRQGTYKNLGHYIFKDGNKYFIQVSSWIYKSSALNHMKQLIKEGYHASVEKVISHNGDIYYRVRMGDFKSLAEAKNYIQNK